MKIAIYATDGSLSVVYDQIENPKIQDDVIEFDRGAFTGITDHHILLSDDADVPDNFTDAQPLDQKATIQKMPVDVIDDLKKQVSDLQDALLTIMNLM